MKSRCNQVNNIQYKNYGGRGIKVCDEWSTFENFYQWCISNGYSKELQIDRKNNDEGYSPDNCRMVTPKVNGLNKKNSIPIEIVYEILEGVYRDLSSYEVSKIIGCSNSTVYRIRKRDYKEQLEEYKQYQLG